MSRWKYVIIHHAASSDSPIKNDTATVREYHTQVRKWRDIGYHFVVEKINHSMEVLMGRPLNMSGAHCPGHNHDGIGVCIMGDFSTVPPEEEYYSTIEKFLAGLTQQLGIPVENIMPHKKYRATICPGVVDIERIRENVRSLRDTNN